MGDYLGVRIKKFLNFFNKVKIKVKLNKNGVFLSWQYSSKISGGYIIICSMRI